MEIKTEHSTNKTQREKSKKQRKGKRRPQICNNRFRDRTRTYTHKHTTHTHFGKLLAIASSNTQLEENQKAQIFFA